MDDKIMEKLKLKIAISEIKKESEIAMNKKKNFINTKIGIAACICIVLTTGVVFSKDIESYFKNLFTNSSEAINDAIENGYVQSIEDEYVYDKDIGVKVDSLVLDEMNLNISFAFEVNDENIKSIRFKDVLITSDSGRKIFESELKYAEKLEDVPLAKSVDWSKSAQKISDTTFIDSILFGLRETENEINSLKFEVTSLHIRYLDDTLEEVEGNWNFEVEIIDEMKKKSSINYVLKDNNEYVESCTGVLSATGLNINLRLKEDFDAPGYIMNNLSELDDTGIFYLKNNSELFAPLTIEYTDKEFIMPYDDIGTFSGDIEKIELYLEPFDETITLIKDNV